jgi:hypothetical protein
MRWTDRAFGRDLHGDPENLLQLPLQGRHREKRCIRPRLHEEIEVAVRAGVTPGARTEYPQIAHPMLGGDLKYQLHRQSIHAP